MTTIFTNIKKILGMDPNASEAEVDRQLQTKVDEQMSEVVADLDVSKASETDAPAEPTTDTPTTAETTTETTEGEVEAAAPTGASDIDTRLDALMARIDNIDARLAQVEQEPAGEETGGDRAAVAEESAPSWMSDPINVRAARRTQKPNK